MAFDSNRTGASAREPPPTTGPGRVGSPILVTGMARSGTSWVGEMLAAGREVGVINEPFNLAVSPAALRIPVVHWYSHITRESEPSVLPPLRDALAFHYPIWRQLRHCRTRGQVARVIKAYRWFSRNRKRRPLIKDPNAVFSAEWFADRLASRVVVVVRHPAAVVSSWMRLGWTFDFSHLLEQPGLMREWLEPFRAEMEAASSPAEGALERAALLWRVIYSVVLHYRRRDPEFRIVLQEELSGDPMAGYARLYRDLDLSFTEAAAAEVAASTAAKNPKETSLANPYETRIDSRANLQSWRKRLTAREIDRVRGLTEEVAAAFYPGFEW